MQEMIRAQDVRKTFTLSRRQMAIEKTRSNKKVALDGLSFTAYEGQIYGLLGPNGAGKTTMLRILATLIKADSGEAYVAGHEVLREAEKVRASRSAALQAPPEPPQPLRFPVPALFLRKTPFPSLCFRSRAAACPCRARLL